MKTYSVLDIKKKTNETFCLQIEKPRVLIRAGQCFNVGLPGMDINREYSMYSDANAQYLEFLIRAVEGGLVSKRLQQLKVGEQVEVDGPYGEFCIQPAQFNRKFVFIASGTGVAPFHSFIKTYPDINYRLIHGVRYATEKYDEDDYLQESYIPCISRNDIGPRIRADEYIRENQIDKESLVYLCGNRNMIIDCVQILLDQGLGGDQIISEVFF
jgi:ferredoxin--NADP+ reductase